MPENAVAVKSIVSTPLADAVAANYGVELRSVLTGFKWIGDQIARLEAAGEVERFIFGFEESYGYLAGPYVRDKDAIIGSMLICEMAAYYRSIGSSLKQRMEEIYDKYGRYLNKVDSFVKMMADVYEFYNLGIGDPVPVSANAKLGIGDMLDIVTEHFNQEEFEEEEDDRPKIAIVGKPNVGKSSIINKLIGEQRVIVSDIAGTTRDAIDTDIVWDGKEYVFIDTAGLRRKSKIKEELERYSIIRTVTAVDRADVVVVVIDATEGVTEQDAKIAGIAHERGKGIIVAVNKWDAVEKDDKAIYRYTEKIRMTLSFIPYAEIMFISAETGKRLPKLFEKIDMVLANQAMRVQTGVLNEILTEAVALQQPPSDKGKRLKLYYITQVSVKPPTFVIFVNDKQLTHFSYTRYLENKLRDTFGFQGTPLRFIYRERKEKE